MGRYLVEEYAPHATEHDPVGRERYSLYARDFNGIELDLDETYAWGWEELHRIEHAMRAVAERIIPGVDVDEVIEHLETDPNRAIEGVDEFRRWNQELLDTTVAELDGTHFDIPVPGAAGRGDDRALRGRRRDVLHGPLGGLLPPGAHVVPDARQDALSALGRSVDLLPRRRPRPSPADRAGAVPRRHIEPVPAHPRGHVRARRGLGALRRTAHGRARLSRRPGIRAGNAPRAGNARGARRRRHRHAPRARDPGQRALSPRRDVDARPRASRS